MNPTLQKQNLRPTLYFVGMESLVIVLMCLIAFGGWRGGDFFGVWPAWVLICLLVVLLTMSLAFLARRSSLAVSGLLVFFLVTAAGFLLPIFIR